jgi:hypothetical protein
MSASLVTFLRPANTTAYGTNDCIGAADVATPANAGNAVLSFLFPGASSDIIITSASLMFEVSSGPAGAHTLHLFAEDPDATLDNAAFALSSARDLGIYRGSIALGTPAALGSVMYCQADGINKHLEFAGSFSRSANARVGLYGKLVTAAGWTPGSGTRVRIRLNAVRA